MYGQGPKYLKIFFENIAGETLTSFRSITNEAKKNCGLAKYKKNKDKYRNIHCFRAVYFDTFFYRVLKLKDAQIILEQPGKGWPFGAAVVNAGGNTHIEY